MNRKQKKMLIRILITAAMLLALNLIPFTGVLRLALYILAYLVIGYDILRKAWKGILNRQVFDENFLMAVATLGALAIGLLKTGDYDEAVAVMLFYQIGELFQSYAVGKSRRNIADLMDIRPDYANVEIDGELTQVDPEEVEVGTGIVIQPGERVPIDGIVTEGISTLNTSALTGESVPRDVSAGDEIISGCINMTGVLKVRTTKEFGESTVSKVLSMVEESGAYKSRKESFISRFAKIYTPAVCIGAAALAVLPPLIRLLFAGLDPMWSVWIYRALTFLVISCPCALVISIPLSFFAGIGGASHEGILVKGSNYLEALADTKVVVFDKTGTLTQGVFAVSGIHQDEEDCRQDSRENTGSFTGMKEKENAGPVGRVADLTAEQKHLIEYAALAECASSHPVSRSLREAYGKDIDRSRVTDITEISGKGVTARVDGHFVAAGNEKLMQQQGVSCRECHLTGTIIHLAIDGSYAGHIVISDMEKQNAARAIQELKANGVRRTVMLTGDSDKVAKRVAEHLGIDEMHSELLPGDKVSEIERLLREKPEGSTLAFVGDGINDAPVLSRADLGIAMGAMGSDAAIEAADVVLMDDDPLKIVKAIRIARKCIRIVYQNIIFALVIKFACLVLGAFGIANMWYAIFADVGVMVIAVLNAIRALRVRKV